MLFKLSVKKSRPVATKFLLLFSVIELLLLVAIIIGIIITNY